MGAGGLRAYSLSQSDKVNAGEKTCKLLVSQPVPIGECYSQFFTLDIQIQYNLYFRFL